MKYSWLDSEKHCLLEMELTLHLPAWRNLLLGREGIVRRLLDWLYAAFWLWVCCGWQCAWPQQLEGPACYPLALFVAFCAARRSLTSGLLAALLGGGMLDALNYQPLGLHGLLLVPVACLAVSLEERLPVWRAPVLNPLVQGGASTLVFGLLMLLFCGSGAPLLFRCRQLWTRLLPAAALAGLLLAPLLFVLWGGLVRRPDRR